MAKTEGTHRSRTATSKLGATPEQLREAERGLRVMLSARFSERWIERHVSDLLSEAAVEYAEWLEDHSPHRSPAGWLAQRGWWRAIDTFRREEKRPTSPIGAGLGVADPEGSAEEVTLELDRGRRLAAALARMSEKDRRLVELVHVEGYTVTEAARLLGWGRSTATEHLNATLDKLAALIGPRDQIAEATLAFVVGLAAEQTLAGDSGQRVGGIVNRIVSVAQDLSELASRPFSGTARRIDNAFRRFGPFADPGVTLATTPIGRALAQGAGLIAAAVFAVALINVTDRATPPGADRSPSQSRSGRSRGASQGSQSGDFAASAGPENGPYRARVERRLELKRAAEQNRARLRREARRARQKRARVERRKRRREAAAERRRSATRNGQESSGAESSPAPEEVPIEEASVEESTPEETAAPPTEGQAPSNGNQVEDTFNPFTKP